MPAYRLPGGLDVAVLVPCYNEEVTVGTVVRAFKAAVPGCTVYVYDNNSSDRTVEVARAAGAVVGREPRQGKGHVVRRMFADVEADVYVLVDGDATYDAPSAPRLIAHLLDERLDMVVGARQHLDDAAYRPGHQRGNRMLTSFLGWLFGDVFSDILSGYRVFSRRFVKTFPALAGGFETETELSIHALELRMPVGELTTPYSARPEGSQSKLSTYRDGLRIARTLVRLYQSERPLRFFTAAALLFGLLSVGLAVPLVITYLDTGLVPRFPTAILSASLMLLAFLATITGLILDTVTRGRQEMKRLAYLQHPAPAATEPP